MKLQIAGFYPKKIIFGANLIEIKIVHTMLLETGSTGSINLTTVSVDGKSGNSFETWEETEWEKELQEK